jgi:hypothetical protein
MHIILSMARLLLVGAALLAALTETLAQPNIANFVCFADAGRAAHEVRTGQVLVPHRPPRPRGAPAGDLRTRDFRCLQFANLPRAVALLLRCDFSGLMGMRPATEGRGAPSVRLWARLLAEFAVSNSSTPVE